MKNDKRNKIIVMSIMSYYAKQIFDETKSYEFRKSPLRKEDLDKKIYVYSAKEDKAIIGYMKLLILFVLIIPNIKNGTLKSNCLEY